MPQVGHTYVDAIGGVGQRGDSHDFTDVHNFLGVELKVKKEKVDNGTEKNAVGNPEMVENLNESKPKRCRINNKKANGNTDAAKTEPKAGESK